MVGHCNHRFLLAMLLGSISQAVCAEGIVDIKPYVGLDTTYDDNIFRYASPEQAKLVSGSSATSDTYVSAEAGVNVNLRLSRQLISLNGNINKNQFSRFKQLDNVGKSYGLNWSWRLGNNLFGDIGSSDNSSISSFNELVNKTRNIRTTSRQYVNANWQFHPSWIARVSGESTASKNDATVYNNLDRESDMLGAGIQYAYPNGTLISLDYRNTRSKYPNRAGVTLQVLGNETTEDAWILGATWLPTGKTRISANLSEISLDYKNTTRRGFSGLSESVNIDYTYSSKTSVNFSVYKQVSANDDLVTSYVESTGFSISPSYRISEKLNLNANVGFVSRDYLGNAGFIAGSSDNRVDEFTNESITLNYLPTNKSLIQFSYSGGHRNTGATVQGYDFNSVNMSLRYNF